MKDFEVAPTHCLACGEELDAATNVLGSRGPKSGDLTVCIKCGHLMAFDDKLQMRALTDSEMIDAAGDEMILAHQWMRGAVFAKREGKPVTPPSRAIVRGLLKMAKRAGRA